MAASKLEVHSFRAGEIIYDEGETKLDALVCNAGAMAHERTLTKEGVEITFASHLLFGTYLLGLVDEYWAMRRPWQYGTKQPQCGLQCDGDHCEPVD